LSQRSPLRLCAGLRQTHQRPWQMQPYIQETALQVRILFKWCINDVRPVTTWLYECNAVLACDCRRTEDPDTDRTVRVRPQTPHGADHYHGVRQQQRSAAVRLPAHAKIVQLCCGIGIVTMPTACRRAALQEYVAQQRLVARLPGAGHAQRHALPVHELCRCRGMLSSSL
jgi:hypothetical protein